MFRKIALAAAGALTLGVAAVSTAAPASAAGFGIHIGGGHHGPHFGIGFHPGYHAYYPRHYYHPRRHCERVVVRTKVHGEWRRVVKRRCYSGRW